MIARKDLSITDYDSYFEKYIQCISPTDDMHFVLNDHLSQNLASVKAFDKSLNYSYAVGKWSAGALLMHCIDTERIFQYRALSIMRGATHKLAGFDQDVFAQSVDVFAFAKADLLQSMEITRAATIDLYRNASIQALEKVGVVNGKSMAVKAIPFIVCGHWKHHLSILESYY